MFSLFHCETLRLAARKVSSLCSMSLDISPGPVTRQFPSPNSKEITPDAASCRCGRGEKRTKEDAMGFQFFGNGTEKYRALSSPIQACCPLKTPSVDLNHTLPGTASKSRERKPRPLPPEPGTRRHMLSMRHRLERFFHCRVSKWKKTKRSPVPSSQSRAGRAPRGAGALPLWIASAWRRVRRKARRVRRNGELEEAKERLFVFFLEEKTKRTNNGNFSRYEDGKSGREMEESSTAQ